MGSRGGRRRKNVDDVDAEYCVDASTPTHRRVDNMRSLKIPPKIPLSSHRALTSRESEEKKAKKAIPPTSVEAERAFSAAGLFVTKIRSSLDDNAINELCFLRKYFLNPKSKKEKHL